MLFEPRDALFLRYYPGVIDLASRWSLVCDLQLDVVFTRCRSFFTCLGWDVTILEILHQ